MIVAIFENYTNELEEYVNEWMNENKEITIKHILQSSYYADRHGAFTVITIFYE